MSYELVRNPRIWL